MTRGLETPLAAPRTIGVLGAGWVGTAIARQALKAGYELKIATAKPVDEISLTVELVTPGAVAVSAAEAAQADIVVLAIPLSKHPYRPKPWPAAMSSTP